MSKFRTIFKIEESPHTEKIYWITFFIEFEDGTLLVARSISYQHNVGLETRTNLSQFVLADMESLVRNVGTKADPLGYNLLKQLSGFPKISEAKAPLLFELSETKETLDRSILDKSGNKTFYAEISSYVVANCFFLIDYSEFGNETHIPFSVIKGVNLSKTSYALLNLNRWKPKVLDIVHLNKSNLTILPLWV